jgi:hypothetical protein
MILGISVSRAQKSTRCRRNFVSAGRGDDGEVRRLGQADAKHAQI